MRTAVGVAVILAALMLVCPQGATAMEFLSFGTGSPAGHLLLSGCRFRLDHQQPRAGGAWWRPNPRQPPPRTRGLLIRGEMELGLACMGTLKDLKDQGMDVDQVRLVAVGHTSDTHWIVRKDSPIKSIADFKGRTIGVGPAGSATLQHLFQEAHRLWVGADLR